MATEGTRERLLAGKLVAIARGVAEKDVDELVAALYEGGIRSVEFTFDYQSEETLAQNARVINRVAKAWGDRLLVGAGTVLTPREVDAAVAAGAAYIVSPNTDEGVIGRTKRQGAVSVPGAFTPSEIAFAHSAGADIVKLFPAGSLGAPYIKAVRGPLAHIPLMATGGITVENCLEFLRAGCVGLGVGGNLVSLREIAAGNFAFIRAEAQKYTSALGQL